MNVKINTSTLNDKILKALSKISDDCILTLTPTHIESISSVASGAIITFVQFNVETDIETEIDLYIKGVGKLKSVLNCIKGEVLNMDVLPSEIRYTSDEFKFKFGLNEEISIVKPKIKKKKIENMNFNTTTPLNTKIFYDILKASSFLKSEDVKLYFFTQSTDEGSGLYCDITDRSKMGSDNITIKLSDTYDGEDIIKPLICDVQHIRMMSIMANSDVHVYFNTDNGFTVFDVIEADGRIRYLLPSLEK